MWLTTRALLRRATTLRMQTDSKMNGLTKDEEVKDEAG
jgi:hypothetical protein